MSVEYRIRVSQFERDDFEKLLIARGVKVLERKEPNTDNPLVKRRLAKVRRLLRAVTKPKPELQDKVNEGWDFLYQSVARDMGKYGGWDSDTVISANLNPEAFKSTVLALLQFSLKKAVAEAVDEKRNRISWRRRGDLTPNDIELLVSRHGLQDGLVKNYTETGKSLGYKPKSIDWHTFSIFYSAIGHALEDRGLVRKASY